jgi:hypothetical protein
VSAAPQASTTATRPVAIVVKGLTEVLVNDVVLGVEHTLDSPLAHADRLTLLAHFMGGR